MSSVAVGTGEMWVLVDEIGVQRTSSWFITTAMTSLFNFSFLRRMLGLTSRRRERDGAVCHSFVRWGLKRAIPKFRYCRCLQAQAPRPRT